MDKRNKIILGIFLFMLGSFTICGNLTDKLISNFTKKTIDTTLSIKYAGCSVTGTEGALTTTTASSSDATSGINNWYCRKTDGTWEVCPDSAGCTSYKLTGWLGYDKVKAFDKAGNESGETDLYTINSANSAKTDLSSADLTSGLYAIKIGTNPVHIIDYKANVGEITKAQIKDGRIKLTGKPAKTTISKPVDNYLSAGTDYLCKFGKPVEKNGSRVCDAVNYRLQNETCTCVFDKDSSGVYTGIYNGGCQRDATFCSDNYDKGASADTLFKVITKVDQDVSKNCTKEELDRSDEHIDCFSSNYFDRELNSSCFTYYNNSNFKNIFNNLWYQTYDIYAANIKLRNGNYLKNDVKASAKNLIVNASKSIENPCNPSMPKVVNDQKSYISAGSLGTLCSAVEKKLNAGEKIYGLTTDDNQFMVPFVGSAKCLFDTNKATKESNFSKYSSYSEKQVKYNYAGNSVYYCDKGELVERDGTYQCKVTAVSQITTYAYDWTVNYYRKK